MNKLFVSEEFKKKVAADERAKDIKVPTEEKRPHLTESVKGLQTCRWLLNTQFEMSETIVDGLLREKEMVLFAGPPKVGKSRLSYQLAISLANGKDFLGMKCLKKRVLYLDLENKPEISQERVKRIGHESAETDSFVLYVPENIAKNEAVLNNKGLELIKRMIGTTRPDVLFIDPLRIFGGMKWDERKCEDVIRAYSQISEFFELNKNLSIIIIHHTRKSSGEHKNQSSLKSDPSGWIQGVSGSYSLIAHSESIWGFARELAGDGEEHIIFHGMARNWRVPLLLLEDCPDLSYRRLLGEEFATGMMTAKEKEYWSIARDLRIFKIHSLESACKVRARLLFGMIRKAQSCGVMDYSEGQYFVTVQEESQLCSD